MIADTAIYNAISKKLITLLVIVWDNFYDIM